MKQQFLKFCRFKIDFFDSQLLFFIKEKIDLLKNLEQFFSQEKIFIDIIQKKAKENNQHRNYNSIISKEWFLDFVSFAYTKETCSFSQKLAKDFFLSYLSSIDTNLYSILQSRFLISLQIGEYKRKQNLKIIDKERWQSLLVDRIEQAKNLQISVELTQLLLDKIHQYSVKLQLKNG